MSELFSIRLRIFFPINNPLEVFKNNYAQAVVQSALYYRRYFSLWFGFLFLKKKTYETHDASTTLHLQGDENVFFRFFMEKNSIFILEITYMFHPRLQKVGEYVLRLVGITFKSSKKWNL